MEKGILVTKENMMMVYGRLKKVVETKQFLVGRNFYTRSLKVVNKKRAQLATPWMLRNDGCEVSCAMFGVAGIIHEGNRIFLNRKLDRGYFYIQPGNRVFIDPLGKIFIERTDYFIHKSKKFILVVEEEK